METRLPATDVSALPRCAAMVAVGAAMLLGDRVAVATASTTDGISRRPARPPRRRAGVDRRRGGGGGVPPVARSERSGVDPHVGGRVAQERRRRSCGRCGSSPSSRSSPRCIPRMAPASSSPRCSCSARSAAAIPSPDSPSVRSCSSSSSSPARRPSSGCSSVPAAVAWADGPWRRCSWSPVSWCGLPSSPPAVPVRSAHSSWLPADLDLVGAGLAIALLLRRTASAAWEATLLRHIRLVGGAAGPRRLRGAGGEHRPTARPGDAERARACTGRRCWR